jgi:hypothetical protein
MTGSQSRSNEAQHRKRSGAHSGLMDRAEGVLRSYTNQTSVP